MYYDVLAKIKNAERAKKESMLVPYSKMDFAVATILAQAHYVKDVQKKMSGRKAFIEIKLKYRDDEGALRDFKIVSKPSRHIYVGYRELKSVKQGYGLALLSTPKGIMSNREARKQKMGGEYLCEVW
jgi:small subunit ribosomal protein S8